MLTPVILRIYCPSILGFLSKHNKVSFSVVVAGSSNSINEFSEVLSLICCLLPDRFKTFTLIPVLQSDLN